MDKQAFHAHDRGKERLGLSPESVNALQQAADRMWFSGGHRKLAELEAKLEKAEAVFKSKDNQEKYAKLNSQLETAHDILTKSQLNLCSI